LSAAFEYAVHVHAERLGDGEDRGGKDENLEPTVGSHPTLSKAFGKQQRVDEISSQRDGQDCADHVFAGHHEPPRYNRSHPTVYAHAIAKKRIVAPMKITSAIRWPPVGT